MANEQNLTHVKPGQVLNPNGRPKGSPNRKTILHYLLFEAEIEGMDIVSERPVWMELVKPKTIYELMVMAQAIKAIAGDTKAFTALNDALGVDVHAEAIVDVMHIYKPEKLNKIDDFNSAGAELRRRTREAVEAEVVDDMEGPARTADHRPAGA